MKRFVRYSVALIAVFILSLPAGAVFKEKNLNQTLAVLHFELKNAYAQLQETSKGQVRDEVEQHQTLIKLIENCKSPTSTWISTRPGSPTRKSSAVWRSRSTAMRN